MLGRLVQKFNTPTLNWGPWIALYSAITFVMLGIDMALLHLGYQHYHFMALMPVVFCGVAALVSFVTTFSGWLRLHAWVTGVLALIVGGIGTVIHLELAFTGLHGFDMKLIFEHLVFDPRPPLAPAALAGTGLLMILVSISERWPAIRVCLCERTKKDAPVKDAPVAASR